VFDELQGVESVESGYMGGKTPNPTTSRSARAQRPRGGRARDLRPDELATSDLLAVFFSIHDPTTLNRQGNDVGTQYRSAIFFHSPEQKRSPRR
jgi:peptide-methionine (S)-S-oxide reductase